MKPALIFWGALPSTSNVLVAVGDSDAASALRSWLQKLSSEVRELPGEDGTTIFLLPLDAGNDPDNLVKMAEAQLPRGNCLAVGLPNPADHLRAGGSPRIEAPGPSALKGEALEPTSVAVEAVASGRSDLPPHLWRYAR